MMIPTVDIATRVYNHKWKIDQNNCSRYKFWRSQKIFPKTFFLSFIR